MRFYFSILLLFLGMISFAQNEIDALRYSTYEYGGTSRFKGMGGAFGALGGDASVYSVNPAGIGVYRKSESTATVSFANKITNARYLDADYINTKSNLYFDNAAFTVVSEINNNNWEFVNFGISYNKIANFNNRYSVSNQNANSSLLDIYRNELNDGGGYDPALISSDPSFAFGTNLAWQTYLVDTFGGNQYYHQLENYNQDQESYVTERGAIGETVFAVGGNYDNKLYIGGGLGFPKIRYVQNSSFTETTNVSDTMTYLKDYTINQYLKTEGRGFNLKVGAIYRLHDFVRVGFSWHSPTFYSLTDKWNSDITANYGIYGDYSAESPNGSYNYDLKTPGKVIGSAAILFGKVGLISIDYEYSDFRTSILSSSTDYFGAQSDNYSFSLENKSIRAFYRPISSLRIGSEFRYQNLRFRAGAGYQQSPVKSFLKDNRERMNASVGFGVREKDYFLDFAYVVHKSVSNYKMYETAESARLTSFSHQVSATLGFRF